MVNSLKWLAFSKRVLTVRELAEIFIIDPDKDIAFDENARLFSSSTIVKYFSGLIVVEESLTVEGKVRLVHFSIKEYLTSDRIEGRVTSAFSFTEADAHIYIARSCLAYITHLNTVAERSTEINGLKSIFTYHLTNYAAQYWMIHLEEVHRAQWPAEVALSAILALADHSRSLLLILTRQKRAREREFLEDLLKKPHCYTAYSGFRQLTEVIIAQKHGANEYITQEDLDFGLYYAADGGHLDIVQSFLEKGANINAHCGKWDSAVHAAVSGGHLNVLEFLVSNGADVNSQPALFAYITEPDTHLLEYLLDHGMHIDMQDEQHGAALHKAITDKNFAHFELLLERGADINALNEKLGTPLQVACVGLNDYGRTGDRVLCYIERLLECGADPNIRGGKYATALQAACSTIFEWQLSVPLKVVRLLIKHGADVNIQGGYWGSPLHAAAASPTYTEEKIELMKLLLDNGAKIDQQSGDWGTPLHLACHEGTIEAVRFLVDRDADVNAEGGRFGTPILAAAAQGDSMPILNLLMDKGANITYQGGEYGSALQALFHSDYTDVELFYFLLKHCPDVNSKSGKYGTALIAACAHPHSKHGEKCVRLLLDHGADINAQSDEYGTALMAACDEYGKNAKLVQWLLECGADVNAQGSKHGTALSAACSRNYSNAVQLLLDHGANIHLQDCAAWYSAIRGIATLDILPNNRMPSKIPRLRRDDAAILELLLNRGMDINHQHAEYGTALHVMMTAQRASKYWREGINVLLKHHINPNIMNERLGSALHRACEIKYEDVRGIVNGRIIRPHINSSSTQAAYLLEQFPNIDVNIQGGTFCTALQAAAYSGQTLSVRLLLDREAVVNVRGGKYYSALNGAIISGHWNIVKILLAAGATPDCHLQEQPNEDWLQTVLEEDGRGAVERYRKFWEVETEKKMGERASNS